MIFKFLFITFFIVCVGKTVYGLTWSDKTFNLKPIVCYKQLIFGLRPRWIRFRQDQISTEVPERANISCHSQGRGHRYRRLSDKLRT